MLKAMQAELDREKSPLVLPGMQRPYFIEYRLEDVATYEAIADYGALSREEENHQRLVRVTVRIGDYAADSSTSRGDGVVQLGPQDNNPQALRYASGSQPMTPTRSPCAPTPPSRPRSNSSSPPPTTKTSPKLLPPPTSNRS